MSSIQLPSASAERAVVLLAALREARLSIENMLASLSPQDLAQPTSCSGWSVRDQIGHIIDSTEMLVNALEQAAAGNTEGLLQPHQMAPAMQVNAIKRAALLPLPQLQTLFRQVSDRLLKLLSERDASAWDDGVGHPYLGTCSAVQIAGLALLDWYIHPWDIQVALEQEPRPRSSHAALLVTGIASVLPKRLNVQRGRRWPGRFRLEVEKDGNPSQIISSIDIVVSNGAASVERNVPAGTRADLVFKGPANDLVLGMLGRKGLAKLAQPSPTNDTWIPRWRALWISL